VSLADGIARRLYRPPPRHLDELRVRAAALAGCEIATLAAALGAFCPDPDRATAPSHKGRVGALVEAALGATAGSRPEPDFPHLGVELKTVPIDAAGRTRESTFVCVLHPVAAATAVWATSLVRKKLAHVLWIPVLPAPLRLGTPCFWRPSVAQEAILQADFEELIGLVGAGEIEHLSAHRGRWLQVRPKAAHGRVRARILGTGDDGDLIETVPRGFYLRARFTRAILKDPAALP